MKFNWDIPPGAEDLPRPGTQIDDFLLLRLLGQGGMGQVYLARDERVGREVALKLLTGTGEASRERFQREGELASRLRHPGIVQVHSAGEHGSYRYLVCELVPGARPLDEAWREVRLRRRVSWVRAAARALGYAHGKGVVHRDVKPANLLVDERGTLRVADFGVAAAADLERLTQTGAAVGTPTHMSPEQLSGERATPATDVWGLGVVLYQALTDELPFAGRTWMQLVEAIKQGATPPSSSGGEVPRDLEQICLAALSPEPGQRPRDGEALAEQLDDWLAGRTPRASGRRSLLLGGGLLGLGLAAGAGALVWRSPARRSPPPSASPSPRALTGEELLVRGRAAEAKQEHEAAYRLYLAAAEAGVREAQERVAQRLFKGEGVAQDVAGAMAWWRRAGEAGSQRAALNLSLLLSRGDQGVERDPAEALRWLRRAAQSGDPEAQARLGYQLVHASSPAEQQEGLALVREAAQAGSAFAMATLGTLLLEGGVVERDVVESARWLKRGAELDYVPAMRMLAEAYWHGRGVEEDDDQAMVWWGRAAESGDPRSMTRLAICLIDRGAEGDAALAERWVGRAIEGGDVEALVVRASSFAASPEEEADLLRRAAEAGHEQAMRLYAQKLLEGEGVPRDPAEAERWFARSAEWYLTHAKRGSTSAMHGLAKAYLEGRGVARDPAQALRWFEEAAKRGHVRAMSRLGQLLMSGVGTQRDPARGARWLKQAAEEGDARAMTSYGIACWNGWGVARDQRAALRWYRAAADNGSLLARVKLALALSRQRPAEAEALLRRTADAGFVTGMRELGLFLIERGDEEGCREGLSWLRRAEERGDEEAPNSLGVYYATGKAGLTQDYAEAARHFQLAARRGHANAAYSLGHLYTLGEGVPKSAKKAAACFRRVVELAGASGDAELQAAARKRLEELE
ncbi:MAG TPA: hypothetical protein DEA08_32965 [Planctomycetes bacterium]|nr:hypothetical protein [Planctomycetota bacterium]